MRYRPSHRQGADPSAGLPHPRGRIPALPAAGRRHGTLPQHSLHAPDFVGGLIGTTASVAGLGMLFGFDVQVMAVLGLCICIIATLGDLVESVMKRYTGIKDSGHIIPGHGGIWDRFDSVIYTVPFVYYFVQFVALR
ncbi:MAG: phosphatidate cytidylyltransferase [Selenomonadaceae bacterium]|nr:phosphatidate cytidylyltransferase [Selenomonadaceae bacterium]